MFKKLIKSLISGKRLAGYAAEGIQQGVNGSKENTQATIAKYATLTNEVANIGQNLSTMLMDGKVDEMEKEKLQALLTPLFDKVLELV